MKIGKLLQTVVDAFFNVEPNDHIDLAVISLEEVTYKVVKVNTGSETFVAMVNPWGDGWRMHEDDSINDIPIYAIGLLLDAKGDQLSDDARRSVVRGWMKQGEPFQFRELR